MQNKNNAITITLLVVLILLVGYMAFSKKEVKISDFTSEQKNEQNNIVDSKTDKNVTYGQFYIVFNENSSIFWNQNDRELTIDQFPMFKITFTKYSVSKIENSFFFSNNPKLKRTLKITLPEQNMSEFKADMMSSQLIDTVEPVPVNTIN